MTTPFATFSASIARLVTTTAPLLATIRTGPNRHVSGLLVWSDTVITTDQGLPIQDLYTVVLPTGGMVAARPGPRDRLNDIASLRLDTAVACTPLLPGAAVLGSVMIILATDHDAAPTVRMTVVHKMMRTAEGMVPVPDLAPHQIEPGAVALDAEGRLLGLIASGPNGEASLVPATAIRQSFQSGPQAALRRRTPQFDAVPEPTTTPVRAAVRSIAPARGWLGVALQPITIPDPLVARTGQKSGRMVVSMSPGGPAERAGLRIGDILLTVNGTSTSGNHVLRAFLSPDKIGTAIEVGLLRDGNRLTARMIVAAQPD
ncbi:MAG: PDZ domain-containing protein [Proteobacteria bacterium]|nr:PDZ domain-containing protein [Pseudomonadota bacterium]